MGFIGFARFLESLGGYDFDSSSDFFTCYRMAITAQIIKKN